MKKSKSEIKNRKSEIPLDGARVHSVNPVHEVHEPSSPGASVVNQESTPAPASPPNQTSEIPALSALTESSIHQNKNPAPDASANNQSSIINNQSAPSSVPNQKSETINHKSKSKPFQPLPEFASLSREQLDYIHEILHTKTYDEAQQEIWSSLGCRISTNRLQRYREKIDLAAALEIADEDTIPAVDQLNNILAARETNIPAAGLHLIHQRALALAASPKTSPTLLKDLFRIFTYEDRKNDNAHRKQITEQREATRKQTAAERLELRRAMNDHRKATDLRRLEIADRREKTRTAAFEHQKQIDYHNARLAEQREQTRKRLADLAVRKHDDALKLAAERNPRPFNQEKMTQDIEAIMAFGREFLRQEAAAKRAASMGRTGASPTQSVAPNQKPEMRNQK